LPNKKILKHAPKRRIPLLISLSEGGIKNSNFDKSIKDTKDLIWELRDSTEHFNIEDISQVERKLIDRIKSKNDERGILIADFDTSELLPFVQGFAKRLI
jgi:di/tripeptidase